MGRDSRIFLILSSTADGPYADPSWKAAKAESPTHCQSPQRGLLAVRDSLLVSLKGTAKGKV